MTFYALSALVNAITSSVLAIFVVYKKKSKININFSFFSLSVAIWSYFYFFWQTSDTATSALFWTKMLTIGSILIPIFYFKFTLAFLDLSKEKINKILLITSYVLAGFFIFLTPTNLLVKNVTKKLVFDFWPNAGNLYWMFLLMFISLASYSIILYIKKYRSSSGTTKSQIRLLLFGTGIGFLGGSTNFILWYDIPVLPIGNILVSLYVFLTAYAIIKHKLMDIKLVMRKYTVLLLSIITILIPAITVKYIFIIHFNSFSNWADVLILILSISSYPILKNYFYRLANKFFFSSLYDSGKVIAEISNKLRTTLDIGTIYQFINDTLANAFHFKAFAVLTYNPKTKMYSLKYNNGFDTKNKKNFPGNDRLNKLFTSKNKNIITEEVKEQYYTKKTKATIDLLKEFKVEILAPLNVNDKTIGLIVLGQKESGDMYNEEDLQVLNVVNSQAAIAIENATLYKETLNFNIKLKKEVEKRTKELKSANEKLTQLDKAKSEFISIASHQLRTPLTVIKGYISMILEGNFGELDMAKQESLEKVYQSNERLIQLVENLLNISRIESGRLQFNYEIMQFEELVDSVVDELSQYAKKKGLKLIYKKPAKKLPKVRMDEEKLRQVVMNLTDNAIKYTKKGTVTVTLKLNKNKIDFCVSDSGMGISPTDLPNLFKKFSRGTGTSVVHTEGTGLGLYVADQMIKYHKGKVWAESDGVGKGSKFCFLLPVYKK